ncbi:hypothetical protein MKX03_015072 [Papaver bracteatum]|nr:hypothetical protein MKX03_015072 [Papaver bracteatum]
MLDWDPKGKNGPKTPFLDVVTKLRLKKTVRPSMMAPTEIEMAGSPINDSRLNEMLFF